MRTAALALISLALLAATGCGSREPTAAPATTTPAVEAAPSTATPTLTARQIIQRSNDAMNRLQSARVTTEGRPTVAPNVNESWNEIDEFVSPNRTHFVRTSLPAGLSLETTVVGNDAWTRTPPAGAWLSGPWSGDPVAWPQFHRLEPRFGLLDEPLPVTEPRILRDDSAGDQRAWVVSYSYKEPSTEGPFNVFVTEWIEKETYFLLRDEHYDDDPFGVQARVTIVYSDLDAPISIEPPG